jgi:hypothetical protein
MGAGPSRGRGRSPGRGSPDRCARPAPGRRSAAPRRLGRCPAREPTGRAPGRARPGAVVRVRLSRWPQRARPASVVRDDAQHRVVPRGARAQCGQQARRERHRVKSAAVRPPLPHLAEQLLLELCPGHPALPAQPRDQQRLARIGQQANLGKIAKRPQGQPCGEQRRATADHHLAAVGIGDAQLPLGIGPEADLRPTDDEPPGLGVVHRGRPHRRPLPRTWRPHPRSAAQGPPVPYQAAARRPWLLPAQGRCLSPMPPSHPQNTIEVQVRRSAAAGLSPSPRGP